MRPRDRDLARRLENGLRSFHKNKYPLPGIQAAGNREAFLEQVLESIHRILYISVILKRDISGNRINPGSEFFDPIKGAALCKRNGHLDEAFWLVFLSVHFGKHRRTGFRLTRQVYGSLGKGTPWNWQHISSNPKAFRKWLSLNEDILKNGRSVGHFGNHRKYQSLSATSPTGTGAAFESYVDWVQPYQTHQKLIQHALVEAGNDQRKAFDFLYNSMNTVVSFGRTAKFDYLTMIGKLGLAPVEPGSVYLEGATGPLTGARLLFGGNKLAQLSRSELDQRLVKLESELNVGMQVLEDSLCNWQKDPAHFFGFRG